MLQSPITIFQITDIKFSPDHIEFSLHKPIYYSTGRENKVCCAKQSPFEHYRVGDFVGISMDVLRSESCASDSKIWDDTNVISKVVNKPPQFYQKRVISDSELGDGWVEIG